MHERGGEGVARTDRISHIHRHSLCHDVVISNQHGAPARTERDARRAPVETIGACTTKPLGVLRKIKEFVSEAQLFFIQLDDVGGTEQIADEIRRSEARPEIQIVEACGRGQPQKELLQHAFRPGTRGEQRSVIEPVRVQAGDLSNIVLGKRNGVVRSRTVYDERRPAGGVDVNARASGREPLRRLQEARVESQTTNRSSRLLSWRIRPQSADQHRCVLQTFELNGEVQGRAAEARGI